VAKAIATSKPSAKASSKSTAKQPAQPAQRVISPDVSRRQRIAAAKAHFRMSSINGNSYVKGQTPLYAKYFQFDNPTTQRKVIVRKGVSTASILAAIGSE
jgi:hypothetical protein